MVTAKCLNENCDKDPWELSKHPADYARGVTCPSCGSTRTDHDAAESGGRSAGRAPQTAEPQQQAQAPATADSMGQEELAQTGMTLGNMLHSMNSDDPEKQAEATGSALTAAGMAVAQLGQKHAEKKKQQNRAAKNTDSLETVDEYPNCPECGRQVTTVKQQGEFPCPHCGVRLRR